MITDILIMLQVSSLKKDLLQFSVQLLDLAICVSGDGAWIGSLFIKTCICNFPQGIIPGLVCSRPHPAFFFPFEYQIIFLTVLSLSYISFKKGVCGFSGWGLHTFHILFSPNSICLLGMFEWCLFDCTVVEKL